MAFFLVQVIQFFLNFDFDAFFFSSRRVSIRGFRSSSGLRFGPWDGTWSCSNRWLQQKARKVALIDALWNWLSLKCLLARRDLSLSGHVTAYQNRHVTKLQNDSFVLFCLNAYLSWHGYWQEYVCVISFHLSVKTLRVQVPSWSYKMPSSPNTGSFFK